jgi:hypothetical protein
VQIKKFMGGGPQQRQNIFIMNFLELLAAYLSVTAICKDKSNINAKIQSDITGTVEHILKM